MVEWLRGKTPIRMSAKDNLVAGLRSAAEALCPGDAAATPYRGRAIRLYSPFFGGEEGNRVLAPACHHPVMAASVIRYYHLLSHQRQKTAEMEDVERLAVGSALLRERFGRFKRFSRFSRFWGRFRKGRFCGGKCKKIRFSRFLSVFYWRRKSEREDGGWTGGAGMNIEHSTSNAQHPMSEGRKRGGCTASYRLISLGTAWPWGRCEAKRRVGASGFKEDVALTVLGVFSFGFLQICRAYGARKERFGSYQLGSAHIGSRWLGYGGAANAECGMWAERTKKDKRVAKRAGCTPWRGELFLRPDYDRGIASLMSGPQVGRKRNARMEDGGWGMERFAALCRDAATFRQCRIFLQFAGGCSKMPHRNI